MTGADSIDWEDALWSAVAHLQALIRIDTVNPPGNEVAVVRYLRHVFHGADISTTMLEPAPGRATIVARLTGDGSRRPLLLLAHMDVVGVEKDKWTQAAFGGELNDGYLYGRGAIDDKGMLAANLQAMLLLKRHVVDAGQALSRDVVFVATADEETGGTFGIDWLVANRPDLLDAEYALNEGGRLRVVGEKTLYCAVQCAEKVPNAVVVTARGTSGHAAVPLPDNPIGRLARALSIIAAHQEPLHLTDVSRGFFGALAGVWHEATEAAAMADIASADSLRVEQGARVLSAIPTFNAVLRNGISPTMLSAGIRSNVIPAEASCVLNVRTLPGESIDLLVGRLRSAVTEPGIDFRVRGRGEDAPAVPVDSEMFQVIGNAMHALDPGVPVVPYLSTGATDSAPLRRLGVKAYGLLPFPLTLEDEGRMHGHDERVPVASLGFGVRLVYEIAHRMST